MPTANKTCYAEDGEITGNIPCGFSSINTCCGQDWDCLSNGLCRQSNTTLYSQGSCTNANFEGCLNICNKSIFYGGTSVHRCGINSWCCAGKGAWPSSSSADCCTTTSEPIQPFPFSTIDASEVGLTSVTIETSSASSSSPSPTTSSLSSKASSTAKQAAATALSTAAHSNPSSSSSNGLSTGVKVGISVAVPIVVLLLAALLFVVYKFKKRERYLLGLQRRDGEYKDTDGNGNAMSGEPTERQGWLSELGSERRQAELGSDALQEMSTVEGESHELPGRPKTRLELAGI